MRPTRQKLRAALRDGWRRLAGGELTAAHAGWSVFAGALIGATPLWGLHLAITLLVCVPLRLDARVAYLVTQLCNPLLIVWLWWAELELGSWMRTGHGRPLVIADDPPRRSARTSSTSLYGAAGADAGAGRGARPGDERLGGGAVGKIEAGGEQLGEVNGGPAARVLDGGER